MRCLEALPHCVNLTSLPEPNERKIQDNMAMIPSNTIEQVAAANDIVEVIGSYFPLKRAGANFRALCPFHQEKTPSFHVSPQRQTFHCFGCGAGGSVFRFVMDYEHTDFPSAVRKLGARVGIPVAEERGARDQNEQREVRRILLRLHSEATEWFHDNLLKKEFAALARDYLKKRGVSAEIAKRWKIGFAPDEWDAFGSWARGRGYERDQIAQSGLVKLCDEGRPYGEVYDRFRGRIMFPICNDVGEVIAFSGRLLDDNAKSAKYVNSPETPLFRKGNVLFGLDKTKRALMEANCAVVVEGQLDLIALYEAGITNVVAPQGTAFTESQARVLKRFVDEVVLCFDADPAGSKAAERSLEALLQKDRAWFNAFAYELTVRIAEMPAGEDPDSLIRREGKEAFEKRIAEAPEFFDYWIARSAEQSDLTSTKVKMQLARQMAVAVSYSRDPFLRGELTSKVSSRLGVSKSDFETLLPKPQRERGEIVETATVNTAPAPRHDIAMLCLLALHDEEASDFLREQNWREVLAQIPNTELLVRILESELRVNEAASLSAFMATLTPADERLVSSWLVQKMPANAATTTEQWWMGIRHAALRRQLEVVENRLRLPELSGGEVVNLQKQILDLREQLHELPKFSSAPKIDS
jgi:DNA primase